MKRLDSYGFTIVSTLVAAGIGVVIMTAFTQQLVNQTRSTNYLEAKMETLNLKQELTVFITGDNGANCNSAFANKSISFTNASTDQTVNITSTIAGTPLASLIGNYTTNNRLITITSVNLFHPALKANGSPNTSTPYEFKLKMTAREKFGGSSARTFMIDGPKVILNMTTLPLVNAAGACGTPYTCPAGQVMSGYTNTGVPICINGGPAPGTTGSPCTYGGYSGITSRGPRGRCCLTGFVAGSGGGDFHGGLAGGSVSGCYNY